jgi:hypothetical protein
MAKNKGGSFVLISGSICFFSLLSVKAGQWLMTESQLTRHTACAKLEMADRKL